MLLIVSYGITTADRPTIKKIAGKIIPAISTTTAFVTGAIALELFKIMGGLNVIENYRSCFANLSIPMFCFTEPGPCKKYSYGGHEWSEWDHIIIPKGHVNTLGDFIHYMKQQYQVDVAMVNYGEKLLYMGYGIPVYVNEYHYL